MADGKLTKMMEKHEKKWKQKFIKIWQYNDMLETINSQAL